MIMPLDPIICGFCGKEEIAKYRGQKYCRKVCYNSARMKRYWVKKDAQDKISQPK